jgi:homoaconitate hydratase family protein
VPTLTEKILRSHTVGTELPNSEYLSVEPDLVLGHEATIALLIARLRKAGRRVFDPSRCFFAADHFVPPATAERAGILHQYLDFVREEGISTEHLYQGISHQILVEDRRCRPGALIAGADSHTTMAGVMGCFATGFGSTDILALLATGRVFVKIPDAILVRLTGDCPVDVMGKDVALELMGLLGEAGAAYKALEFIDETTGGLTMSSRMNLTNMAVECGAKNGVFVPDQVLREHLTARDGVPPDPAEEVHPDNDAVYERTVQIDLSALTPRVARPGSPADVVAAADVDRESITQVFIGSCCGGRLEDLQVAANVLSGQRVASGVRLVITPASQQVYKDALANGVVAQLVAAGAMVTSSSCGACGGIDKGVLGAADVCVSTSNRNFRGRMGHNDSRVYLASARTAAAAAVAGHIVDPGEVAA